MGRMEDRRKFKSVRTDEGKQMYKQSNNNSYEEKLTEQEKNDEVESVRGLKNWGELAGQI